MNENEVRLKGSPALSASTGEISGNTAIHKLNWEDNMPRNETREELARYAHDAWAGWMKYMLGKCRPGTSRLDNGDTVENGTLVIPVDLVERWQRQMNTPYWRLPENEKESDRAEADKMLAIVYGEEK